MNGEFSLLDFTDSKMHIFHTLVFLEMGCVLQTGHVIFHCQCFSSFLEELKKMSYNQWHVRKICGLPNETGLV